MLDSLVADGVLDVEIDEDGEMQWQVPGAARPLDGPDNFAALERTQRIRAEARRRVLEKRQGGVRGRQREDDEPGEALMSQRDIGKAMSLARRAATSLQKSDDSDKHKSLLVSAGLSFFGPLGWLYAGAFKEAVPAAAIALAIAAIVPTFLLMPVLWIVMPLSSLVGLAYAFQYNRTGGRTRLFLDDKNDDDVE